MRLLAGLMVLFRFLQTAAFIGLFFFSLIKLKEPKRQRIWITVALYVVITFAFLCVTFFFGRQTAEFLIVPAEMLLCLVLLCICSAERWSVSIFIMFTQFNLLLGICYMSDQLVMGRSELAYQVEYVICRTVLFSALLLINVKVVRPRLRRLVEILEKEWPVFALAALFFYVLEAAILYYPRMYWYEADNRWYLVASSYLMFLGVYWLIFQSIGAIVKKFEIQEREYILAQQNKMWVEQLEAQKNAVSAARRDRHDLRHHYDTLLSMLQGGKTQEAVLYLNAQTKRTENLVLSGVCEHLAANVILSGWEARASAHGIKTHVDAKIPENLPMDEVSLVGIIANAFENAVEGCLRCSEDMERTIAVRIAYSVYQGLGKLHMVFENPCVEDIQFEGGYPRSQKPGGGTGTKSICYTAERYRGLVEFTAEDHVFKTRVLLHLHQ